jgi:hypothetical protein
MTDLKSELDVAESKSEEATLLALDILTYIAPNVGESMLLRVIEALAKVGEVDMQGVFGMNTGSSSSPLIQEAINNLSEYLKAKKRENSKNGRTKEATDLSKNERTKEAADFSKNERTKEVTDLSKNERTKDVTDLLQNKHLDRIF